jgi:drug efflux transport system permease protein
MKSAFARLIRGRFWALALKELRQIRRDRRLVISLIVPPTLQILLFGFALTSDIQNLRLGVVDESRTAESRELISALTENRTFHFTGSCPNSAALEGALSSGRLDVGVVVPYDFARRAARGRPVTVQVLLNAVNANTAQIAEGYVEGAVAWLDQRRDALRAPAKTPSGVLGGGVDGEAHAMSTARARSPSVEIRTAFLYNPGLINSWFIVTGVRGTLIILHGSLMTPASALEAVAAKIVPLFVLLMGMVGLALTVARLVFHVPFRGSLPLVLVACACCVLTGIGLGTFISTFVRSANQAQLISFFVNPPLATLSGALTPIEAMPPWIQPWTLLNPIAHFAAIARGVLVKGAGLDSVYPNLLVLAALAALLVGISALRFRRQLA